MDDTSARDLWGIYRPMNGNNPVPSLEAVIRAADKQSAQGQARRLGFRHAQIKRITPTQAKEGLCNEGYTHSPLHRSAPKNSLTPESIDQAIHILKALHRQVDQADIEQARGAGYPDHAARQRQISESRIVERLSAIEDSIAELRKCNPNHVQGHSHGNSL